MILYSIVYVRKVRSLFVIILCLCFSLNGLAQNALHFNDWVSPAGGGQVDFNTPVSINGTSELTVEVWVRIASQITLPQNQSTNILTMYTMDSIPNNVVKISPMVDLSLNDSFEVFMGIKRDTLKGNTAINDSNWHHIAMVYQANQNNSLHLYIDGVLDKIGGVDSNLNNVMSTRLWIGYRLNGCVDELRIWNKALSQTEILGNMNTEICQLPPELTAYFKFNEGVANGLNYGLYWTKDEVSKQNAFLRGFTQHGNTSNFVTGSGITPRSNSFEIHTIDTCDTYTVTGPSGQFYNLSGTYYDTLTSYLDCDSVIRTDLTYHNLNTNVVVNQYTLDASQKNASFRWMDCDNNYTFINGINGISRNFIPPNPKGWYAVQISAYGCVDTSACYSLKGKTTDLSEILPHLLKVYPNPSKGQLTVSHPSIKNGSISVYDITGRVVLLVEDLGDEETIIDLSTQPKGVYSVKFEADGEPFVKRVVLE